MKAFILGILIITSNYLNGQAVDTSSVLSIKLGVSMSHLLSKIIPTVTDSNINVTPYILTARVAYKSFGLRLGVGGRRKNSKQMEGGFADSKTTTDQSIDGRIGMDYQNKIGKRMSFYFGVDALYKNQYFEYIEDSGFDVFKRIKQYEGFGAGPVLGFEYHFNEALSISTEAAFYWLHGKSDDASIYTNYPEFNDFNLPATTDEIFSYLPTIIYLNYSF